MKKLLILGLCLGMLFTAVGAAAADIVASGTGEVVVEPDSATLNLGVSETGKDMQVAQQSVNSRIEAVRQALVGAGVERGDIAVSDIYLYTNYDYSKGSEQVTGYSMSHTLVITVRDLNKLGEYIDVALGAGANQLNGVSFLLSNSTDAYLEALALATKDARAHAEALAAAAGLTLGKLDKLEESSGGWGAPYALQADSAYGKGAGTTVDVSSLTISATVMCEFDAE